MPHHSSQFREDALRSLHSLALEPFDNFDTLYQQYLELGQRIFGLEIGIVSHIAGQTYTVLASTHIDAGTEYPLGDTYCAMVVEQGTTVCVAHMGHLAPKDRHPAYKSFGLESYISTSI